MVILGPNSPNLVQIWPLEAGDIPEIAEMAIFGGFSAILGGLPGVFGAVKGIYGLGGSCGTPTWRKNHEP